MYRRKMYDTLFERVSGSRRFIQILAGPRQTGKTTIANQLLDSLDIPVHYASADLPSIGDGTWIQQQWEIARLRIAKGGREEKGVSGLLMLDEIHKVPDWADTVKAMWDADSSSGMQLHVLLLGSSPLLVRKGAGESLAGRFEIIRAPHWSFGEMKRAFGWEIDQYIYYGGYPGAAALVEDPDRWRNYIHDSLIETTISRDILLMSRIDKPVLLRRLFDLGCSFSGQVLSYNKMLGQLHDAGNTTTLAHYMELLDGAGFLTGLQKFSRRKTRQRSSSPKLQVLNNALMSASSTMTFENALHNRDYWGRLVESSVGAHLVNEAATVGAEIGYWRDRSREVDFVVDSGESIAAVEVKSGRTKGGFPGMDAFLKAYPESRMILVGSDGMPVEEFLTMPLRDLIDIRGDR